MAVAGGALETIDAEAEDLPLMAEFFGDDVGDIPAAFCPAAAAARSTLTPCSSVPVVRTTS